MNKEGIMYLKKEFGFYFGYCVVSTVKFLFLTEKCDKTIYLLSG